LANKNTFAPHWVQGDKITICFSFNPAKSMHPDRIFKGESTFPTQEEWFYRTREGVAGPYPSREAAAFAQSRFIKYCRENQLDGGRHTLLQYKENRLDGGSDTPFRLQENQLDGGSDTPFRRGFPKLLARLAKALTRLAAALEGRTRQKPV
jgi:hypothetical protein